MAFAGFLRLTVWILFFLYAATYTPRERREILDAVAYEGALLSLITIVGFLYDGFAGIEDANGRIDGFFQYANTWSLFLLICLMRYIHNEYLQAALVFGYFALAYYLDFSGRTAAAYALYPADLSLAENRLQSFSDVASAEPVADAILASTDLSLLPWDCKLAACAQRGNVPGMVESKYQYLRLSRYRGEVYQEFTDLLENACVQSSETELVRYQTLAQAVITQLEEVNQTTSPFAYRIVDKPELDFFPQIRGRLNQIIERIDAQ